MALCSIITFGSVSQICNKSGACPRFHAATVAFFFISFVLSLAALVLWFVAGTLAAKAALPASALLFAWTAVGLAMHAQVRGGDVLSVAHVCVMLALVAVVYNVNELDLSGDGGAVENKEAGAEAAETTTGVVDEPSV